MANDAGPEAKRWALAATAILTTLTRKVPRHDLLGGTEKTPETEGTAKTILANSWTIDGRDKLIATLEWLGSTGHNADYQKAAADFAQASPQQRQGDPKLAFVNQFGTDIGTRGLIAWDLGRSLAVAGWGYLAGYCTEDEAWGACFSAGARLRATYKSWDEYAKHYRLGALFWDAAAIGPIDAVIAQLASAPDSPWSARGVPWSLDGAPAAPPGPVAPVAPPAVAAGGFGPPLGGAPGAPVPPPAYGAPPGAVGPGGPGAAPPGVIGGPPPYAPVAPPPGAPGAPAAYGGVPVIAGAPVGARIPPGPGAAPSGGVGLAPGGLANPANKKKIMMICGGGAVLFLLVLVVGLTMHFRHHDAPPDQPVHHGGKHGGH